MEQPPPSYTSWHHPNCSYSTGPADTGGAGKEDQCDWRVYQTHDSKPHVFNRFSKSSEETEPRKLNSSKRKRLRRKQSKMIINKLNFVGNNADGLGSKLESLENILRENPAAVFVQETHFQRPGRIKTPSSKKYTWYELNRTSGAEKGQMGGGIAIGVINSLKPSWISEGDDECEALTVEIWVEGFPIRLVC